MGLNLPRKDLKGNAREFSSVDLFYSITNTAKELNDDDGRKEPIHCTKVYRFFLLEGVANLPRLFVNFDLLSWISAYFFLKYERDS